MTSADGSTCVSASQTLNPFFVIPPPVCDYCRKLYTAVREAVPCAPGLPLVYKTGGDLSAELHALPSNVSSRHYRGGGETGITDERLAT